MKIKFNKVGDKIASLTISDETFCESEDAISLSPCLAISLKVNSNVDYDKLNDLYKKLLNRNERTKKMIEMGAPDLIINNEKRMLEEAVEDLVVFVAQTKM